MGADLGRPGYLQTLAQATQDIDVQVLFLNAGYMLTGFFETKCAECSAGWHYEPTESS